MTISSDRLCESGTISATDKIDDAAQWNCVSLSFEKRKTMSAIETEQLAVITRKRCEIVWFMISICKSILYKMMKYFFRATCLSTSPSPSLPVSPPTLSRVSREIVNMEPNAFHLRTWINGPPHLSVHVSTSGCTSEIRVINFSSWICNKLPLNLRCHHKSFLERKVFSISFFFRSAIWSRKHQLCEIKNSASTSPAKSMFFFSLEVECSASGWTIDDWNVEQLVRQMH